MEDATTDCAAFAELVLGRRKIAETSNEIIAIPKLLDMLAIEGAIVTIDAMGRQRDIARKIVAKLADYALALNSGQGCSRKDVEPFVTDRKAAGVKDHSLSRKASGKASLRLSRNGAGWDDDVLVKLIARQGPSPDCRGAHACRACLDVGLCLA